MILGVFRMCLGGLRVAFWFLALIILVTFVIKSNTHSLVHFTLDSFRTILRFILRIVPKGMRYRLINLVRAITIQFLKPLGMSDFLSALFLITVSFFIFESVILSKFNKFLYLCQDKVVIFVREVGLPVLSGELQTIVSSLEKSITLSLGFCNQSFAFFLVYQRIDLHNRDLQMNNSIFESIAMQN